MRKTRMSLAAFAALCVLGLAGIASAMEHNIRDLQAKLEAQEARINDFHAKLNGDKGGEGEEGPDAIISMRKNAKVSIGGIVNTKYTYTQAKIDSRYAVDDDPITGDPVTYNDGNGMRRRATAKGGNLEISDAYLFVQVDVNDNLEARLEMDLHNGAETDYAIPEVYFLNWKNFCETGFGLKVGRDALTFGTDGIGELASYAAGSGDGLGELDEDFQRYAGMGIGRPVGGALGVGNEAIPGIIPMHNGWDVSGVTQLTPYWEGLDGKFKAELSLFTSVYDDTPYLTNPSFRSERDGYTKYRSRNYGIGSFAARVSYSPIEDLNFTLSAANYRSNGNDDLDRDLQAKNNFVYGLAASYRPCFLKPLNIWAQWVHGNNVYNYRDMKSDAVNFGASWDFTENLTVFAQGDYLRSTYKHGDSDSKGTAWAVYSGIQYSLPYGVSFEVGWKHEKVTYKSYGERQARVKGDTIYAMCGFEF